MQLTDLVIPSSSLPVSLVATAGDHLFFLTSGLYNIQDGALWQSDGDRGRHPGGAGRAASASSRPAPHWLYNPCVLRESSASLVPSVGQVIGNDRGGSTHAKGIRLPEAT